MADQDHMASRDLEQAVGAHRAEGGAHMPGPWSISEGDGDLHVTAPDAEDPENPWNVAIVIAACGYPNDPRTGSTEANARLIAAAPELKAACARAGAALAVAGMELARAGMVDAADALIDVAQQCADAIGKAIGREAPSAANPPEPDA